MALKHVVSWKLNGATLEERNAQAEAIFGVLGPLAETVPSVRSLTLHRNELFDGENFDITLIAEFDDAEGLAEYVVHPEHVAAGSTVKPRVTQRVATDFTV